MKAKLMTRNLRNRHFWRYNRWVFVGWQTTGKPIHQLAHAMGNAFESSRRNAANGFAVVLSGNETRVVEYREGAFDEFRQTMW